VEKRAGVYVTNKDAVSGANLEGERSSVVRQYEA